MTEQERKPLRGAVAQLLNSRELVINLGHAAGVTRGMRFDVLDPKGEDVEDPETGESLGSLSRSKVRVKVIDVRDKMSVASTFRKRRVNVGGWAPISDFSKYFTPEQWTEKPETFRADDQDWAELEEEASFVKIGDPVIEVLEPEPGPRALQKLQVR